MKIENAQNTNAIPRKKRNEIKKKKRKKVGRGKKKSAKFQPQRDQPQRDCHFQDDPPTHPLSPDKNIARQIRLIKVRSMRTKTLMLAKVSPTSTRDLSQQNFVTHHFAPSLPLRSSAQRTLLFGFLFRGQCCCGSIYHDNPHPGREQVDTSSQIFFAQCSSSTELVAFRQRGKNCEKSAGTVHRQKFQGQTGSNGASRWPVISILGQGHLVLNETQSILFDLTNLCSVSFRSSVWVH